MELNGKVALVTGASSGIGAATALKLASRGVKVGLAARRLPKLKDRVTEIEGAGGQALAIEMDVVNPASVQAGVDKLIKAYGGIDLLHNNAGLMPLSDIETLKVDEWHRMVDVNVKGVLNSTAAVLPRLIARGEGHIINTSSIAGRKVFPGLSVYCATKHAITAFSEGLRLEIAAKHKIRVTCVQPGAVDSELYEHITDPGYRKQMDELREKITFLSSEDVADAILFALQAPAHVNVAEVFVLPIDQPW